VTKEETVPDRLHRWKRRIFDLALFVLFIIGIAKFLYFELFH